MEAYRKLTPISRGKSKAIVESSLQGRRRKFLVACRDIELLACVHFWALEVVDGDDLINDVAPIP